MSKGGYIGGHSLDGPGGRYFSASSQDGNAPRKIDDEIRKEMELQDELRKVGKSTTAVSNRVRGQKKRAAKPKQAKFRKGDRVFHAKFGRGVVLGHSGKFVEVFFECEKTARLLPSYLKPAV